MSYTKQTFVDKTDTTEGTILKAEHLNRIEEGIGYVHDTYKVEGEQVIIGVDAMKNSSTEYDVVAIGAEAMQNIVCTGTDSGRYNTAVGVRAMQAATTSDHSTALGFQAMQCLTTGCANNGLGEDALYALTTGGNNTAVGTHTAQRLIDGSSNTYVGTSAALPQLHGSFNTLVGMGAGTTQFSSGYDITTMNQCTFIGMAAGSTVDNVEKSIALGAFAQVTGSNQIVIGGTTHTSVKIAGKTINFNDDGTVTWS